MRGISYYLLNFIDIAVVYYIVYKILLMLRGTRAIHMISGVFLLLLITVLSKLAGLNATFWLLKQFWVAGIFIMIVVFQPEIRNALASLGSNPFTRIIVPSEYGFIFELSRFLKEAASKNIGALVILEQDMKLGEYIRTGRIINAETSYELLISIFSKNSPLHDGAVIISGNRLVSAKCQLPLTERKDLSTVFGMRHRAAIGISEITDAIAIVVSEERGLVSVARNGHIMVNVNIDELERDLLSLYKSKVQRNLFRRSDRS